MSNLISPASLRDALPNVTVIDVRWRLGAPPGRNDFEAGRVPGAAYLDMETELCGPPGVGGRHPLPDPADLQRALRNAGVTANRPVVIYDYGDGLASARAWWTLRWAGHTDVRVLDGGYPIWQAAGFGTETGTPEIPPGDFVVEPGHMTVLDAAEAADWSRQGVLLDARQPPRYRGETEPIDAVAGHIPGALNVPYADLIEADGRLRSTDALRDRFAASNVKDSTAVAAYCGSGITAAHTVLALSEAGIDDAGLYVGSWSHWIGTGRPIATGGEA